MSFETDYSRGYFAGVDEALLLISSVEEQKPGKLRNILYEKLMELRPKADNQDEKIERRTKMTATKKALQYAIKDHEAYLSQYESSKKYHEESLKEINDNICKTEEGIVDLNLTLAKWFPEAGGSDGD